MPRRLARCLSRPTDPFAAYPAQIASERLLAMSHRHEFVEENRHAENAALPVHRVTIWRRCKCGLGLRTRSLGGGLYEVRVQITRMGDWIDPVTVLRTTLPFGLCPDCKGDGCPSCKQLGITRA